MSAIARRQSKIPTVAECLFLESVRLKAILERKHAIWTPATDELLELVVVEQRDCISVAHVMKPMRKGFILLKNRNV